MARGKTSADPAELEKLEWPHAWAPPWRNDRLVGHDAAEKTLLAAQQGGRLHHAWLMTGPRGIGKATLAWRFAKFLLCGDSQGGLFGGAPDGLYVPADAPGRSLIDARSHPDLFHLRRTLNHDTGRMRAEISVDDVRDLGAFMHMTPAMGKWRVAIVDAADEMNRNAANAVLKVLEEPPPNAVLLIVAHAPGRLLPTIRSRCRRLAMQPLGHDTVMQLLGDYAPDIAQDEKAALANLAEGSIGRALELASAGSLDGGLEAGASGLGPLVLKIGPGAPSRRRKHDQHSEAHQQGPVLLPDVRGLVAADLVFNLAKNIGHDRLGSPGDAGPPGQALACQAAALSTRRPRLSCAGSVSR